MQGGKYGNALQAALVGGHDEIVRLLLERGADVNAQGGWHRNVLRAALRSGCDVIVRLLLENGATDEPYKEQSGMNGETEEWHTDDHDGVDDSARAEGDEHYTDSDDGSEEEWTSAEEHPDENTAN
ncbi:hypothetical protein FIBSPDRAFT_753838 [Athelia psychrophila]|uniref:Uncharacterized protein n=1 Tax=Athelia psychrophila TaxID=1759441 RepID=A0A166C0G3_9AGAM|nr:hypothetical protein FIBSPDRAFT_753838 [Fibularhizoctonia sp. CBS 109695]